MLKSLVTFLLLTAFAITAAGAATIVVDQYCAVPGNGSGGYTATCNGDPASNPAADMSTAIGAAGTGDTIRIRGVHATHDAAGCPGSTIGRYFTDRFAMDDKSYAATVTVEASGWTAIGAATQELVYIDGGLAPNGTSTCSGGNCGWTQCPSDCSGSCVGIPSVAGTCADVWYVSSLSSPMNRESNAIKPDGTITYRVNTINEFTNANAFYNPKVCSTTTWKHCNLATDCPGVETCTGTSAEIDAYDTDQSSTSSGGSLFVRWGTGANAPGGGSNPRPFVVADNNGNGFTLWDTKNVTIRGLIFRSFVRAAISIAAQDAAPQRPSGINIVDNIIYYSTDEHALSGSDYGISSLQCKTCVFDSNEIAYTGSEAYHIEPWYDESATDYTIKNGRIHHIGDQRVLGTGTGGTPQAMILSNPNGFHGSSTPPIRSNYTGSVLENMYIHDIFNDAVRTQSAGKGILFENDTSDWTVRNNVLVNLASECFKLTPAGATSNNIFYGNVCVNFGSNPGPDPGVGILFAPQFSASPTSSNVFYNNVFYAGTKPALSTQGCSTTNCLSNIFRNNIFYGLPGSRIIDWPVASSTNIFENNAILIPSTLNCP